VSHPSLGLPPIDRTSGLPPAAARVDAARERIAARALEIALDRDPTMRVRHDDLAVRRLLRDTVALVDRVVEAMAVDSVEPARSFAEATPPAYRRRKVPMHDLITICEAIRSALGAAIPTGDMGMVDRALDTMIERFKWNGRIAGDARKRNRLLAAIYKGA
jgi:hypothetical protein